MFAHIEYVRERLTPLPPCLLNLLLANSFCRHPQLFVLPVVNPLARTGLSMPQSQRHMNVVGFIGLHLHRTSNRPNLCPAMSLRSRPIVEFLQQIQHSGRRSSAPASDLLFHYIQRRNYSQAGLLVAGVAAVADCCAAGGVPAHAGAAVAGAPVDAPAWAGYPA